ncbi:holo-ACP synthase CitX [Vallitalea longa]|uniref:citrate lyase holo-[acyl-carrier protein] synthase n=1 Tax=Vallitalea longa TaxID=2936439 RepID=A0A9W6DHM8_9FIRM|nr:citrate lyase holo-[acyl-carrier protein] synthase [Vallitalea longa]GKX31024.1 holo-ACP synthase CitX [Vallitalea longa]
MNRILFEKEHVKDIRNSFNSNLAMIQIMVNMPGPNKNIYPSYELFQLGIKSMLTYLKQNNIDIKNIYIIHSALGMIGFLQINKDARYIKKICIMLEQNNYLSKYWDIDVFNKMGIKISRNSMQLAARKCFICDRPAKECCFLQRHSTEQLVDKIINDYNKFLCCKN